MSFKRFFFCSILLCIFGSAIAREQLVTLETGLYQSRGDYHRDSSTRILYVPLVLKVQSDAFQFKASGGWLSLKGPGHIEAGTQTASEYDEQGWADSYLAGAYFLHTPWLKQLDWLVPELKIKLPTADKNKALGTGVYDYQFLMAVYRIRSPLTLHSSLSYRWRGSRDDMNLLNSWGFNLGSAWKFNKFMDAGLMFDSEQAASALSYAKRELLIHLSVKISKRVKTTLYSQLGLAKGSPDFSLGTQVAYRF